MFVGRAPRLEELNQLLAGGVVIPFTVAAHDLEPLVEGLLPTAISVQRYGKVEARLVIARVGDHLLFQLGNGSKIRLLIRDLTSPPTRPHSGTLASLLHQL